MYVCLCSGLTEQNVRDAAEAGASEPCDVYRIFGHATQCGTCNDAIACIIDNVSGTRSGNGVTVADQRACAPG